ncbi:MAG: AAA family ATPase [Candidatus Micrarchaeota archaeon]|nr:AAA family ATPase [Candidatus Micrarchaeota archaeon]
MMPMVKTYQRESIIKLPEALNDEYIPEEVLYRDNEIKELTGGIKAFVNYNFSQNYFLYGSTGVGKTLTAKKLCQKADDEQINIQHVYINCWENHTRMSALNIIADKLKLVMPRRGIAVDELYERITSCLVNQNKKILVVLDEADRMIYSKYAKDSLLYDLTRMKKSHVMVILISNDESLPYYLDQRIKSSLALKFLEFSSYTVQQLKDILKERAKIALHINTFDDEVIGLCAAIASKRGDARLGLAVLREAALIAENEEKKKISIEDVYKAKEKLFELKKRNFDEIEKKIIETIKVAENKQITSGELYKKLNEINERTLRNKLENLVNTGVLTKEEIKINRGNSSLFKLNEKML